MGFTYGKTGLRLINGSGEAISFPLSSFNELNVSQLTPTAQGDFAYGLNDKVFEEVKFAGGGATAEDGVLVVSSSASPDSWGQVQLRRATRYKAGMGSLFRGTALFTTGTAGNTQLIGVGNLESGYFFGYQNEEFGIFHEPESKKEIRALTVTVGATSPGTVTVTLDGVAKAVTINGGGDTTQTAYQLSLADYTQVGGGWRADAVGNVVYFISARSEPLDGTYSATGGGITAAFTRIEAGEAPTLTFIPQASWNVDRMDGTGPSDMTLNPQLGNVYQIGFQYLGFGNAFFGIENSTTGRVQTVHVIQNANSRTTPVLRNPNVSGLVASINDPAGAGVSVPVRSVSMATFNEGIIKRFDPKFSLALPLTVPDTNNVWRPIIALKVDRVFRGQLCSGEIDLLRLAISNNTGSTTPKSYRLGIFPDSTVTGDVNFQKIDALRSIVSYATLNAATQTMSPNTTPIFSTTAGGGSTVVSDLSALDIIFGTGRVIVLAVNSDDAIDGSFSLNWYEQQ
jgi:hypothetical protein